MEISDHSGTARGRAFLWAGVALGLLLILGLFTHGFGLFGGRRNQEEKPLLIHQGDKILVPEGSPLRERLTVQPAAAEAVVDRLVVPGIVEVDPARTAPLLTPLAGRVEELKVALGDRVTRGQVVAIFDSPDAGQAYDDDAKAADTYRLTKANLARTEGQHKIGASSDRDLDQARNDYVQASAEYTRTQTRLRAIGALPRERKGLLAVRAPFAGSVTGLAIAPGNMVNDPTQPIMTILGLSTVWVTAFVAEKDVGSLQSDQGGDVILEAYPGETLHGKIVSVSDAIEPDTHRNKVRIAFANANYRLKPNMFASVTLLAPRPPRVLLPTSALLMNNDRTSVFVATAPWTFERRIVELYLQEGTVVPIRSGVAAGEQVVVKGGILLND